MRRAILVLAGTLIYLGIAILIRGGFRAFFSQPALTAVAIVTMAALIVAVFSSGSLSPGIKRRSSQPMGLYSYFRDSTPSCVYAALHGPGGYLEFGR
jgi:hypothetical protein